ncbi:hypothetical protein [Acetobacter fallax]|uniref:Uncharacterized protein n=1 Tax=Acetobacter fallax TaxID=1737473 RepID=A0ABX0KE52_9PROT|nr:hypothetical protein [Acetobacter fallax]NHO33764.1 hypothetical protein [Acetobacter fallax]NHO37325.1 hypothetical protein [Acetobacter fallax]
MIVSPVMVALLLSAVSGRIRGRGLRGDICDRREREAMAGGVVTMEGAVFLAIIARGNFAALRGLSGWDRWMLCLPGRQQQPG